MAEVNPNGGPAPEAQPSAGNAWRRLAIPLLAVLAALVFIGLATLRWDAWVGGAAVQTTNDAYVRAETTRLASRVAGEVRTVAMKDFQRVKSGDLLVEIDPADYQAQVAQAEAGGARISVRLNAAIGPAVAVIGHMSSDTVGVVVAQARLTPAGAMIWCENSGLSPWVMA